MHSVLFMYYLGIFYVDPAYTDQVNNTARNLDPVL